MCNSCPTLAKEKLICFFNKQKYTFTQHATLPMYVYYLHSQGIVLILETVEAFFARARVCVWCCITHLTV